VDVTGKTDIFFSGITSTKAVQASARLAARIGLASTGMRFPLTGEAGRISELTFSLHAAKEKGECVADWKPHESDPTARVIGLTGGESAVASALLYLASATPYRTGGTFG
ncbi:hypothetical protein MXD81_15310, partial [Microbacteriaceae bacterium K1510]|nr:hypothetical protein [Microbacteriaceae bacterium K1510]